MAIVVEYHEHLPVSEIAEGKPMWACRYVYLDGTKCDSVSAAFGFPSGWSGQRTMTREAIDNAIAGRPSDWG